MGYRYFRVNITTGWDGSLMAMSALHFLTRGMVKINNETMVHSAGATLNGDDNNCSDTNDANWWQTNITDLPTWWKVDIGYDVTPWYFRSTPYSGASRNMKNFTVQGSKDDTNWVTLLPAGITTSSSSTDVYILRENPSYLSQVSRRFDRTGVSTGNQVKIRKEIDLDTDILSGGTATADTNYGAQTPDLACDNNVATYWQIYGGSAPHWWKYDLGAGIVKDVGAIVVTGATGDQYMINGYSLSGSNDDSNWVAMYSGNFAQSMSRQLVILPMASRLGPFRYYKIDISSLYTSNNMIIGEIELLQAKSGNIFTSRNRHRLNR